MDQFVSIRIPRRWLRSAVVLLLIGAVLTPVAVVAAHQFTDVPDSNIFHDDIAWLADNGVTQGCNPPTNDMFCPADNVTREQMAAFMKRLATGQIVDAGTLAGHSSADLTSDAFLAEGGIAQVPKTGTLETVAQLTGLPAGSYVIIAKTFMTYLGGD
ncbi:MAG: S-layer homology domain-containing protein, partial [Actinomycetota bacterium]|nr:S-layer homology domain-containing protein [Actinomycetota bacterium]